MVTYLRTFTLIVDTLHKWTLSQFEKILPNTKAKSSVWEHLGFPAGKRGNKITDKNIVSIVQV